MMCLAGAWVWGQTVPRDRPVVPPQPIQAPVRDRMPTPPTGTGVLKGRVLDGVTGRPIARARVRLSGVGSRGPVLTDAGGGFSFENLPPGAYRVQAEKSTYIAAGVPDPQRSIRNRSQMLVVANGRTLEDVTISLFHSAAIAGRIVDAHGDPLESAMINVMTAPRGGRPQMRGSAQSNDLGEFRISRLPSGRYILVVRPQPVFYGGDPNSPVVDPPIPQAITTYYPGTLSPEEARVIVLNRGETVSGIEMTLAEGVPAIVSGLVVGVESQQFNGNVTARSSSSEGMGGFESSAPIRPDGSFRISLTPGEYVLEARVYPRGPAEQPGPENERYGSARMTITGSGAESVAIAVGRGASATGRVVFEGNTPPPAPPPQYQIPFYNPSGGCRPARATIAADWSFKVEGITGTCGVQPGAQYGRWILKAVNVRGQNIIDRMTTFETGQAYSDVTIVVTDRRTDLEIVVTDETGQPTIEYAALVFPADKERWSALQRYVRTATPTPPQVQQAQQAQQGQRGQRGSMPMPPGASASLLSSAVKSGVTRLFNMPPGDYYAIAFDDMDPEDTMDPAILDKLIPSATRITLTDGERQEVPLRRFIFSDVIR